MGASAVKWAAICAYKAICGKYGGGVSSVWVLRTPVCACADSTPINAHIKLHLYCARSSDAHARGTGVWLAWPYAWRDGWKQRSLLRLPNDQNWRYCFAKALTNASQPYFSRTRKKTADSRYSHYSPYSMQAAYTVAWAEGLVRHRPNPPPSVSDTLGVIICPQVTTVYPDSYI